MTSRLFKRLLQQRLCPRALEPWPVRDIVSLRTSTHLENCSGAVPALATVVHSAVNLGTRAMHSVTHTRAALALVSTVDESTPQGSTQHGSCWAGCRIALALGAAFAGHALLSREPRVTHCQAQPLTTPLVVPTSLAYPLPHPTGAPLAATQQEHRRAWGSWFPWWLQVWRLWTPAPNLYVDTVRNDPRAAVVFAFALPFFSLAFGMKPATRDCDTVAKIIAPHMFTDLHPKELVVLLWGAARLGYQPPADMMAKFKSFLCHSSLHKMNFTSQDAALVLWSLAVLRQLDAEVWKGLVEYIAEDVVDSLDEVTLLHLYQAAVYADVQQVGSGVFDKAKLAQTLGSKVQLLIAPCGRGLYEAAAKSYSKAVQQPGFDGPVLVELTMLSLLGVLSDGSSDSSAYQQYLGHMDVKDVNRAKKLMHDPYLMQKFKDDMSRQQAKHNNFLRQLEDISRTLTQLGLHHTLQGTVEDGQVAVDVALPDYKVAFLLQNAHLAEKGGTRTGVRDSEAFLQYDSSVLSGYAANETPGSESAKVRVLESYGWKCLPITWMERWRPDGEKRRRILSLLESAGRDQVLRGRVTSVVGGTLRGAAQEGSRFQRDSVGANYPNKGPAKH